MSDEQNMNENSSEASKEFSEIKEKVEISSDANNPLLPEGGVNREFRPKREGFVPRDGTRPNIKREGGFRPGGKKKSFFAKKVCKFSTNQIDPTTIDYKNIELLRRFIMPSGKIVPRRITGTCSKYQRVLACEIKKARIMGFLPFLAR